MNESNLNELLLKLFKKHGIDGFFIDDKTCILLDGCIKAHCHVFDKTTGQTTVVQLDVIVEIGLNKEICESCAGIGSDWDAAVNNSFNSFIRNSFHTILAAFFTYKYDDHIYRNTWIVNSDSYDVVSSLIGVRGKKPDKLSTKWIEQFEEVMKNEKLESGINWIRLFYAITNNQVTTCEVLINNEVDSSLQDIASKFDITLTEDFYTLRSFFILQNGIDISRLAAVISWTSLYYDPYVGYDILYDIFKKLGMSHLDIEKAYLIIPIAISHVFIESMTPTVELSTKATVINKEKQSFEIELKDEFFFSETYKWAKITNIKKDSLMSLLQMSPLFNILNEALNEGSKFEDLEFSGSILSLRDYTGNNGFTQIAKQDKKPFWKFW